MKENTNRINYEPYFGVIYFSSYISLCFYDSHNSLCYIQIDGNCPFFDERKRNEDWITSDEYSA